MKYKVGDRFIVEIEETADCNCEPWRLYKMKGFNSLVFDENGLDKLKNQNNETSELKGLVNLREKDIMNLNQKLNLASRKIMSLNAENNELTEKLKKKSEDLACCKILNAVRESQIEDFKKEINRLKAEVKKQKALTDIWCTAANENEANAQALTDELEKLKNQSKSEGYNRKIVCVKGYEGLFTKGRVYQVRNGKITDNSGRENEFVHTGIDEINNSYISDFVELVE
mgnify:CR=1 FL=1|jgi:hypothetical protein